ncbi:hypothetical protein [Natronorubrum sulfidifaciens]|uniref:Uncharacterized protein n=1 Tax=Natronorubrum sulfidifaciens JCM 14089 TaxID=1230460 RepID=L9VZE6_9EURY|nr:hypothetical protein [Natronorubrum sulfidifaciens]ELY42589.1 hypothetical protein C495_14787 [Natronorubrum sulfidifaciens JCM 14089]
MARNVTMSLIGVLSVGALVTASLGWYRTFSFIGGAIILSVIATSTIERSDRDPDLAPYTGLIGGLAVFFLLGLGGIWLTWDPTVTEYSYVLGIPTPTLIYFVFIWLLPLTAAVYYSIIFDRIASEEIVDDIIESAREEQRRESFPLAPKQPKRTAEVADGGEVTDE